jgi:hypothetical protein
MIKFFRKIRQKMLNENKFSKYLMYAIGEIVLVVIGILIALSINNWNENLKNRNIETTALMNLRAEFKDNSTRLNDLISIKLQEDKEHRTYLEIISNDSISLKNKIKVPIPKTSGRRWSATYEVLNGLLSSGEIEKIKNDSLKSLLTKWTVSVTAYIQTESRFLASTEDNKNYLGSRIYFEVAEEGDEGFRKFPSSYYPNKTEALNNSQMINFINDIEYFNLFSTKLNILRIQLVIGNNIQRKNKTIEQLIDLELQGVKK